MCLQKEIKSAALQSDNHHACIRDGYPILFTRKSALDSRWTGLISQSVPALDNNREPTEELQDHRGVLRILREGYVYVLAGTPEKKEYIGYYEVVTGGILREKAPDDLILDEATPLPDSCTVNNHYVNASFFCITVGPKLLKEKPFLWVAYSRYPWDKKARDYYQNGGDLSRFSQINLTQFMASPSTHPRAIDITDGSSLMNILEFNPFPTQKTLTLPNYSAKYSQFDLYRKYLISAVSKLRNSKIGAIVLEDPFGVIEDLNFQRNVESNYTGDPKLDLKTDDNSPNYPYVYNSLFSEESIHKKAISELILEYKTAVKKQFETEFINNNGSNSNNLNNMVYVNSMQNLWNGLFGTGKVYDHTSSEVDESGGIRYILSSSGMAEYKFDEYWDRLEKQLSPGEPDNFINEYSNNREAVEHQEKEGPRDYVFYLRWLLGKSIEESVYLSGKTEKIKDASGKEIDIIYPEQKISHYNEVLFWDVEIDYSNANNHVKVLLDLESIFIGNKHNLYVLGLFQELLNDKNSLVYRAVAGNELEFWKPGDSHRMFGTLFSYLTENDSAVIQRLASSFIAQLCEGLAYMFRYTPDFSARIGNDIMRGSGVSSILSRGEMQISEITLYIKRGDLRRIPNSASTSHYTISATDIEDVVMLRFWVSGNGQQTKDLSDYINRVADRQVNPAKLNNHIGGLTVLSRGTFRFNTSEVRLDEIRSELDSMGYITENLIIEEIAADGTHTVRLEAAAENDAQLARLEAYLNRLQANSQQPSVHTFSRVMSDNSIEIIYNRVNKNLDLNAINEGLNLQQENAFRTIGQGRAVPFAKHTALTLINGLSLLWEYKALHENLEQLNAVPSSKINDRDRSDLHANIVLGYVNVSLIGMKTYGELAKSLGSAFDSHLPAFAAQSEKLGIAAMNKLIIDRLALINRALTFVGIMTGFKDLSLSIINYNHGYKLSGIFGSISAVFTGLASISWAGGPLGLAIALVLVALSIVFALLSAYYSLSPMEIWFDRCALGLREIHDGLKQPYPLTIAGFKQSLNDFQLCIQGIDIAVALEYDSLFGMDYYEPTLYIGVNIPGFVKETSRYEGMLIIEDEKDQLAAIGFTGTHQGATIVSSIVYREDGLLPLNTQRQSINNTNLVLPATMKLYPTLDKEDADNIKLSNEAEITVSDDKGNQMVRHSCTLQLKQKLVKLNKIDNGIKISVLLSYIIDSTDPKCKPLTIKDELSTFSGINAYMKAASTTPQYL